MSNWRSDISDALAAFSTVAVFAGEPIRDDEILVEYCQAPHRPPSNLPFGKMAIYAFWWDGAWLKIGKVGPNSAARYISQHYNAGSARSTLAGSLINDPFMRTISGFDPQNPGKWIRATTCRVNILLPSERRIALLSLLEAFLHTRLKPRYEG